MARSQSLHSTEVLDWNVKVGGPETAHGNGGWGATLTRAYLERDGMLSDENLSVGKGGRKVDV